MAEYRIKPGGMHEQFFLSRKKVQVIGGGFGNGKTAAMCVKTAMIARDYPGSNCLVAMATYAQLNDTIRKEFYKWIPKSSVKRYPTVSDNTMLLKNGSQISFRYLQQKGKNTADGGTSSNLLSATYDLIAIDQIEHPQITYKDFLDVLGRLRGSTPYRGTDKTMPETGPRWVFLAANPSFNWVYHKLIKPTQHYQRSGQITDDLMVHPDTGEVMIDLFEASTYENAHNLPADFIQGLEAAYTGQFRDRYLGGVWGAFEGLVYPQFNQDVHFRSKKEITRYLYQLRMQGVTCRAIEGFDYGIASPSCYLFGFIDPYGRVFIIDGFYKPEMTLQEIGERMCSIRERHAPFLDLNDPIWADPAIFKRSTVGRHGRGAETIKDILTDEFDLLFKAGQNDMLNGITKVAAYLSVKNVPDFVDTTNKGPLIVFAEDLYFLADEFGSYFWKTGHGQERIDVPIDRNDHAMDTLKYMLSHLPDARDLLFNFHALRRNEMLEALRAS